MEMNKNEWNVSNLVWEWHRGNGIDSFYDNITIRNGMKLSNLDWVF